MKKKLPALILFLTLVLIGCGGGGGGGGSSASVNGGGNSVDGWPIYSALSVAATSYANKNDLRLERTQLDKFATNVNPISVTFGDFFQEGQFSAFVVLNQAGQAGEVHFLRWKTSESRWVDDTSRLLSAANQAACVSSQYAMTADFNSDGKPDVYLSCAKTAQLVDQLLFISQPNGTYLRQTAGFLIDGKSAAALDINADGVMDLMVSHSTSVANGEPEIYMGHLTNGNVSFSLQQSGTKLVARDPQSLCTGANTVSAIPSFVNHVSVVPSANGRLDLLLGAVGAGNSIVWLKDLGANSSPRYSVCKAAYLPSIIDSATLTDVYASVDGNVVDFYTARKSSALAMTITKFTLTELSANGGLSTTYNFVKGGQPALISAASLDGVPDLFKVTAGYFRAFDAGCVGTRCSALSVAVSSVH